MRKNCSVLPPLINHKSPGTETVTKEPELINGWLGYTNNCSNKQIEDKLKNLSIKGIEKYDVIVYVPTYEIPIIILSNFHSD